MTRFALMGSPFLGPEMWSPVADRLRGDGHDVRVVGTADDAGSADGMLAGYRDALEGWGELTLVPHSNAGLYVAGLASRLEVTGIVFADALVPGPGPSTPVTTPMMRDRLLALSSRGRLAPWLRWWSEAEADALFPDQETRRRVEDGQPRVATAYLDQQVPTPSGWERLPAAYLAFGDAYAAEAGEAARRGWPVRRLPGRHLHPLVDPDAVAEAVQELADAEPTRVPSSPAGPSTD